VKQTFQDPLSHNFHSSTPTRSLFKLLNINWFGYLTLLVVFCFKHSPVWIFPILIAKMIDALTTRADTDMNILLAMAFAQVILLALNIPLQYIFFTKMSRPIRQMERSLRSALITRLHQLSFSFLDNTKSGKLEAKILRDVEQVQTMCFHLGQFAPMAILNMLIAIAYTSWHQPLMLIFFVVQVPISIGLIRFFKKRLIAHNEAFRREVENMNADVSESIDMIPVTRAHGVEEQAEEDLYQKFENVEREGLRLDQFNSIFGSCTWVIFQLSTMNALAVAAYLAWTGYITVGEVVLYQGLFNMIVFSVQEIVNAVPIASKGYESVKSIGEVLECPDFEWNEGKEKISSIEGNIDFENICFAYPENKLNAIDDFNLKIEKGETIALVGESGSGKTTLMSLLIGFRRADSGRILLDGLDMQDIDMRTWRRHISVVPQQPLLMSGSIKDNIAYGLENIPNEQIMEAVEAASLTSFIDTLPEGIHTNLKEGGKSLSGGQRQRIAIARAFIRDPKVIIFDEATSALDLATEKLVQEAINKLAKGRTTFIIAHRLSTIRHADRIIVMDKGKILEAGAPDELLKEEGAFFDLFMHQY